jgi:lipopolysaccharide/colanic/teichoic acid biosynthesis glycosyltransferase
VTGRRRINGRSDPTWTDTLRWDLSYVENCSVILDGEMLLRAVSAVLTGRGVR